MEFKKIKSKKIVLFGLILLFCCVGVFGMVEEGIAQGCSSNFTAIRSTDGVPFSKDGDAWCGWNTAGGCLGDPCDIYVGLGTYTFCSGSNLVSFSCRCLGFTCDCTSFFLEAACGFGCVDAIYEDITDTFIPAYCAGAPPWCDTSEACSGYDKTACYADGCGGGGNSFPKCVIDPAIDPVTPVCKYNCVEKSSAGGCGASTCVCYDYESCAGCPSCDNSGCGAAGCTDGTCDTTNRRYCDSGTWDTNTSAGSDYCDNCTHCPDGDCNCGETAASCAGDCGACTDGTCDTTNRRYCDSGTWDTNTSAGSDYCDNCTHCPDGDCNCGETAASCAGDCGACTDGTCDTTNRRYCDSGTWDTNTSAGSDYCDNCTHCPDGDCNCGETAASCAGDCGGGPPPVCNINGVLEGTEECEDGSSTLTCPNAGDTCVNCVCKSSGGGSTVWPVTFTNPLDAESFEELIASVINWLLAIVGSIVLLFIIIAGIMYMTAAGDEAQLTRAKKMLFYTILGFAIILISYSLIKEIKDILGITN